MHVVHIDIVHKRACDDLGCYPLTANGSGLLKYDCFAGKRFCTVGESTAGPFVRADHIVFNTVSHAFERRYSGEEGDIVSRPFDENFSGICTPEPARKPN